MGPAGEDMEGLIAWEKLSDKVMMDMQTEGDIGGLIVWGGWSVALDRTNAVVEGRPGYHIVGELPLD